MTQIRVENATVSTSTTRLIRAVLCAVDEMRDTCTAKSAATKDVQSAYCINNNELIM